MNDILLWLIMIAIGATLGIMLAGVISMLRHGKNSAQRSNKLMRYRVFFQFAAVILIAIAFVVAG
jgi:hypothetical protein